MARGEGNRGGGRGGGLFSVVTVGAVPVVLLVFPSITCGSSPKSYIISTSSSDTGTGSIRESADLSFFGLLEEVGDCGIGGGGLS